MPSHGLFQDWQRAGWKGGIKIIWESRGASVHLQIQPSIQQCDTAKMNGLAESFLSGMSMRVKSSRWEKGKENKSCLQWPRLLGLYWCEIEMEGHM